MDKIRPKGITILGWYIIVESAWIIIYPILQRSPDLSIFNIMLACCYFVTGIGILRLLNSARIGAMLFSFYLKIGCYVIYYLQSISMYPGPDSLPYIAKIFRVAPLSNIFIGLFIIFYLTRSQIRKVFNQK